MLGGAGGLVGCVGSSSRVHLFGSVFGRVVHHTILVPTAPHHATPHRTTPHHPMGSAEYSESVGEVTKVLWFTLFMASSAGMVLCNK